ncbi:CNP1-like family protein [Rhodoferax saidenbachensis]|uniref:CNP1-like uncharacterized domain-containing protein n=2 Tax=Rhodoferax saidenbachensis TaxID=1484693 RepID=A0A1P8KCY7_9BURK|nr:CNP1-like family protein [Rhodoferax saidenbachensis]APW43887.1 hypothetical protein RS694_16005 [Rhodoferax saidenbachensis]
MRCKQWWATGALVLAAAGCFAQPQRRPPEPAEWVEESAPAAPVFSKEQLIPIDMPHHVSVKVGIDPNTLAVGGDGVVRYVVVMTNATGTVNAAYEGIRCATDEVKTYARYSASGEWKPVAEPKWQSITDNLPSKHAFTLARQGACENRLSSSKDEVIRALKQKSKPAPGLTHPTM